MKKKENKEWRNKLIETIIKMVNENHLINKKKKETVK
tara:strand:+ start:103 stop:213 length:111 start_codon:yes stop_codon:yes gene_type:complete